MAKSEDSKPWKSKVLLQEMCKKIDAELGERTTDPRGNRVFPIRRGSNIIGCKTLKDVYTYIMANTPPSQR